MKRVLILTLFAAGLLAGCQEAKPTPVPEVTGVTINLQDIHYDLETIEVEAGNVLVLNLINEATLVHDFVIDELPMAGPPHVHEMDEASSEHEHEHDAGEAAESAGPDLHVAAAPGTISTATLTPTEPGRYPFYCSVAGHREAGMEGVLVVTEKDRG